LTQDVPISPDERLRPIIDAAVHRYFSGLARRYVPLLVGVVALALIVIGLPSKVRTAGNVTSTAAGGPRSAAAPGTPGAGSGTSALSGDGSVGGGAGGAGGGGSETGEQAAAGVARSGVSCGPGVLQVVWSNYAPPCQPTFSGDNGGATSSGVSGTEIVAVMRKTNDYDGAAQTLGAPTFAQMAAYAQAMIDLANSQFEFYGRQIVLKTFTGQGSTLQEASAQGQAGAQADAQTEADMGAFIHLSFLESATYAGALADHGIISMSGNFNSESVMAQYDPHFYGNTYYPSADNGGRGAAATVCQRMNGLPAVFAGAGYQNATRVFGLTSAEQPAYAGGGQAFLENSQSMCNLAVKQHSTYNFNFVDEPQQATPIVAQMKAAGVTTVVHIGDPFMLTFLQVAAQQQDWHPEWVAVGVAQSSLTRGADQQGQAVHTLFLSAPGFGESNSELEASWKAAKPDGTPPPLPLGQQGGLYQDLIQSFTAIQAAGPNLTPQTVQSARANLPPADGDMGLWSAQAAPNNIYDLLADYALSRWNATDADPADGKLGIFTPCDNGARYTYVNPNMGSGQLQC
jgi:hypothetical protein